LKLKLTLIAILFAFASMAYAQGPLSNLSIGVGLQGVFPAATFDKTSSNEGSPYPTVQSSSKSVGYTVDGRYNFGRHSALDLSVTWNRNTEYYGNSEGNVYHVQTNNGEGIVSYIARLPSTERLKPFALVGGGLVRFSPNDDYSVNAGSPQTTTKAAFAYGFGSDVRISDSWGIRMQYRGLLRSAPDFKIPSIFGTGLKSHVVEPSIQLLYHF
jgi:opacity protein-like surface antigen